MSEIISLIGQFINFVVGSVTEGKLKNEAEKKQRELSDELSEQYRQQTQEYIKKVSEAYTEAGKLRIQEDTKNKIISENLITMAYVVAIIIFFVFIFLLLKKSK